MFKDRVHRIPRIWSNKELKKFGYLFKGKIANISGWKDIDKQGKRYKNYFVNADEYWISNYYSDSYGMQGDLDNEFFLDLEKKLPDQLKNKFDVVFNHTVLEHVFNIKMAFQNLCNLSKDIVIIVIPFIQQQHTEYGDYWRLTPLALKRLFEANSMELIYVNFNDSMNSSIYIFAIGSKAPNKWVEIKSNKDNLVERINNEKDYYIGTKLIRNSILFYSKIKLAGYYRKLKRLITD